MKKNIILIISFCLIIFLFDVPRANSLSFDSSLQFNEFKIEFSPKNPGANTEVTAKIISYTFDEDASNITWKINGRIVEQGMGKKLIKFRTGDIGSRISLYVFIVTNKEQTVEKSMVFTIGDVDLLWQASTHTPLLYKGKTLATQNSQIKMTAVPHGLGSSENLIYNWFRDYKKIQDSSGIGADTFTFSFSKIFNEEKIRVVVSNINKTLSIEKNISIRSVKPKIIFYEDSPVFGIIFNNALTEDFSMLSANTSVKAEPYFFSKENIENLTYEWKINNKSLPDENKNILELETSGEKHGSVLLDLNIRNPLDLLQFVKNSLRVNF